MSNLIAASDEAEVTDGFRRLAKRVETCSGNDHRGGEYFHFDNSNVSLENDDDPLRSAAIPRGY